MIEVNYTYSGHVVHVIDGDSIECLIDLGFDVSTQKHIRLNRINAAEMNSKDPAEREKARAAKLFIEQRILGQRVFIQSKKYDKYGRSLAEVYFGKDNTNLSTAILEAGLAVPYDGGKR